MAKKDKSSSDKKALKRKRTDDEPVHEHKRPKKSVMGNNGVSGKRNMSGDITKKQINSNEKLKKKANSATKKQLQSSESHKKEAKKPKVMSKAAKTKAKNGEKPADTIKKKANKIAQNKIEEMKFKDRKKLRKQKNVNFELAAKLKSLWEELRKSDIKPDRRTECCDNLFSLVRNRAHGLIFAHDTSRVFQTLLKYGTSDHKTALFEELKEHLIDIMKSKYAKFFVRKILKYGAKEQRDYIFRIIQANIANLARHREAVSVVEYAYNNFANATQRAAMAGGFYGPAFAIFKSPEEKTLQKFVESHPERRDEVIGYMKQSLSPLVDKSVLQHSFVHRLFSDYFACANEEQRGEMIETVHENVVHMLHTHDGAYVAMMCLWHGTAKHRKQIIKSFKTYTVKICKEEFGHMVMLALFDSVDDTKIVQKIILDEMMKSADELVSDKYGRKVLLYLLMPRDPVYFHPDVVAALRRGDNNKNSKKDAVLRQSELRSHVSATLVNFVSKNCRRLVSDVETQSVVMSTIKYSSHDPTAAMEALAQVAAEPFSVASAGVEGTFHHIVDHQNGHYVLKRLIVNDAERLKTGQTVLFSEILVNTVAPEHLKKWTTCNRGCFVLVSLLELNHPAVSQRVQNLLESEKTALKKQSFKGAQVLLKKMTD